jgi:hypothetical protein
MTYRGHFENGVVVLDEPANLPEGAAVRVQLVAEHESQKTQGEQGSHLQHYQSIVGAIDDLPRDFAAQHDHYLHGTPKK